ncbi:MAG TPA: sterol desaturase family protein [Bryobacteraceae bacterium]|jgi:sterol desaturase/sphingolipid hydroxylase (fatty acid hydroxylase superfamily)
MKWEDLTGPMIPVTYLLMLLIEHFIPARQFPPVRRWVWIGALFTTILIGINVALPLLLPIDWAQRHSLFPGSRLSEPIQILLGFLVGTLVDFAYHRAEHGIHFLWRWSHQVHHSAMRVDISGAAYTSPVEISVAVAYTALSSVFILGLSPEAAEVAGFLMAFGSLFQHWNIRTPHWIGYLLQRPESHCLHHEYGIHARNYSIFPLWDAVFGYFHNPRDFFGLVGFDPDRASRLWPMLAGRDVLSD